MLLQSLVQLGAAGFDSVFNVTGLINDVTTWLTGLVPLGGGAMVAYHAFAKNGATDDATATQHARAQKNVLIGTAIGTGAVGLINLITGYVG